MSGAAEVVGVVGGTFDPVHNGHLRIADRARRRLALGRVLVVPTAVPPHKPAASLSPVLHRVAMLRLALEGREGLELCERELSERVSYTIDTMRALRDAQPNCRPLFIAGTDALLQIDTWRSGERLLAEFDLAVVDRADGALDRLHHRLPPGVAERIVVVPSEGVPAGLHDGDGGRIFHLPGAPIPISSSAIRARAATGESLANLVPDAVAEYIYRTGLYRREEVR